MKRGASTTILALRFPASAAALLLALVVPAHAQVLREDFWVPNAGVEDLAIVGNEVYLGGWFTQVGPATGAFVGLDAATGSLLQPFSQVTGISGAVYAVVGDGADGWYIGGAFSSVRGQPRANIAHLDAAGNLTDWNPGVSGVVISLSRDAATGVVYAGGGSFTAVGGQTRHSLAAIDASGAVTPFDAGITPGSSVTALTVHGGILYAVGSFTSVAGQTRNRAASFDATTGGLSSWAPDIDGPVLCMALRETSTATHIYLGGNFTYVNGIGRTRLAMVDGTTGGVGSWNPGASAPVYAMALTGGTSIFNPLRIYVGGDFQMIATSPRSRLALINESGVVQAWNPGASAAVRVLRPAGDLIYAGGDFSSVGGTPFRHLVAIDANGAVTSWDPLVGGHVRAIGTTASAVFAGGEFWTAGGVRRDRLAALSRTSGVATSWNPGADDLVRAIAVDGNTIYVGGRFTGIGGQSRNHLAALDASTGAVMAWNPDANFEVEDVAIGSGVVYAGGSFTTIGGQPRTRLAAVDAATGLATAWDPSANNSVHVVTARGATVYAGGFFTDIGGQPRSGFAALDAATGLATGWNPYIQPDPSGYILIEEVVFSGAYVVAGGWFGGMGGRERTGLAFIDATTALANSWDHYAAYDGVNGLAVEGSTIYVSGNFLFLAGVPRNGLAAVDANTGALLPYNPPFRLAGAGPLVARNGTVYVAGIGAFENAHRSFAVFSNVITGVEVAVTEAAPPAVRVAPNPFRSQVGFRFSVPQGGEVTINIYDVAGRLVRRLEQGARPAGEQHVQWDGRDQDGRMVGTGVYLMHVSAESLRLTAKVLRVN